MALFYSVEDVRFSCQPEPGVDHEGAGVVEVADHESGQSASEVIKHVQANRTLGGSSLPLRPSCRVVDPTHQHAAADVSLARYPSWGVWR